MSKIIKNSDIISPLPKSVDFEDIKRCDLTFDEALLILENIEGLVAIDSNGIIKFFAKDLIFFTDYFQNINDGIIAGKHIHDVHPNSKAHLPLETGAKIREHFYPSPLGVNVARIIPLYSDGHLKGAIDYDIFRSNSEINSFLSASSDLDPSVYSLFSENLKKASKKHQTTNTTKYNIDNLIGDSHNMISIKKQIAEAATTNANVLIMGETGCGKELVAHSIHNLSQRCSNKLIEVNCAAIPESIIESELFGYEDGAFTGARKGGKPGLFELANSGTIFLDEINQLPYHLQPKLLRVLQEREVTRIGGQPISVDLRIIAATNQDLKELITNNLFRDDLFYRLNVLNIDIPPLRDRKEDIPLLVDSFIKELNKSLNKSITTIEPQAMELLYDYSWPGNIRELKNLIERSIVCTNNSTLTANTLSAYFSETVSPKEFTTNIQNKSLSDLMHSYEATIIKQALASNNWNISKTAKALKIERSTLYYKMKLHGLY